MLTELGAVPVEMPRDRDGSFTPKIVQKRQQRLDRIDEIVLPLTARGLTTGECPRTSPMCMARRSARTRSAGSPIWSSMRWSSGAPDLWTRFIR